jgi:DNA-binding response OmpR family regulator
VVPAILVVDDEADMAASYARLLRRQGHRVVCVGSRAAGLREMETQPFRLVIADLWLPDGDGLDVVRAARALPAPVPVLVATVLGSRETRQAAIAAGASAFLAKPFTTERFSALVAQTLGAA